MPKNEAEQLGSSEIESNDVSKRILKSAEDLPDEVKELIASKRAEAELNELNKKDDLAKAESEVDEAFEDYDFKNYSEGELRNFLENDLKKALGGKSSGLEGRSYDYKSKDQKSPKQFANDIVRAFLSSVSDSERENSVNRF